VTHWYMEDGTPVYEVPRADGKGMRDPTIRDARKMSLKPGSTSVIRMAAAPGLERWKCEQAVYSALTLTRIPGETDAEFVARVLADSREQAEKAAEEGTRIHKAIEDSLSSRPVDPAYAAHVAGVRALLLRVCGEQAWETERPLASSLGFGSKLDLYSPEWLWDFKGKDGDITALQEQKLYDEHLMQLAAGLILLGYPYGGTRKAGIIFVSRTHPGHCHAVTATQDELVNGHLMFKACLQLWQAKNNFNTSY